MLQSYKQLTVWNKAIDFVIDVYRSSKIFPKEELFGLTSQLRRAAVAIPANIAEGYCRGYRREYLQFLKVSFSSGAETETHLLIAYKVGYITQSDYERLSKQLEEIMKMLNVLIQKLDPKP